LQELVDLQGLTLKEIIETISLYATEVEGVSKLIDATNIVVGHVLTKEKHPNSDHLSVLTVDVGEVLQIVCGAPNVEAGQTVIVALEGARLPGDFIIKRSTIRGVDSCGMVCSLQELGIEKKYIDEQYAHGIYYFEEEVPVGMKGDVALGMDGETIEIDVMPNRGDLLSMVGVAYEMSAVFSRPLKPLHLPIYPMATDEPITLQLDSPLCFSYYGQVIRNVTLKPSPQWLKARLIAFGIRPINNVVDITNYILALYGQPLHAFDYDALGTTITVRLAHENEELVTLDGTMRILQTSDLVITNGVSPVALAGVMGGFDTEVTPDSKNILLELRFLILLPFVKLQQDSTYAVRHRCDMNGELT
jgi:phenylalanyl-tRNA synthetase beta chain